MNITINIPINTYRQPTDVRADVVQKICEAFLSQSAYSTFHPYSEGAYREATLYVTNNKCFVSEESKFGYTTTRIRGCEMKAAFDALIKAGYYMYRIYSYGSWLGYVCDRKPFIQKGERVNSFNDFID